MDVEAHTFRPHRSEGSASVNDEHARIVPVVDDPSTVRFTVSGQEGQIAVRGAILAVIIEHPDGGGAGLRRPISAQEKLAARTATERNNVHRLKGCK
jgi:hypothetical protein